MSTPDPSPFCGSLPGRSRARGSIYDHAHDYGGDTIDGNDMSTYSAPHQSLGTRRMVTWPNVAVRQAVLQAMGRPAMEEWQG